MHGGPQTFTPGSSRDFTVTFTNTTRAPAADVTLSIVVPNKQWTAVVSGTTEASKTFAQQVVPGANVSATFKVTSAPASFNGDLVGHYKKSKAMGEQVVQRAAAGGLPVVIVNPSTPVGELDIKPTPTGQIVVDFLSGRMPAYVDTGLNVIDVRDVADGHLLAADHGQPGQRYILGNTNLTLKELLDMLARVSGHSATWLRLPHWIPMTIGAASGASCPKPLYKVEVPVPRFDTHMVLPQHRPQASTKFGSTRSAAPGTSETRLCTRYVFT